MFGLSKYLVIGGVLAVVLSSTMTGCAVRSYYKTQMEAERNAAAADALREKNRLEAEYRDRENKQAASTRDMEARYVAALKVAADGRAEFDRALRERLRASARRADNCSVPSAAAPAVSAESREPVADTGLGRIDPEAVSAVRAAAKETQELLRLCRQWAVENGR